MVTSCETRSYWLGRFTEEQQKYYKEYRLSEKWKHLWAQINKLNSLAENFCSTYDDHGALMNLFAVGGINTSLSNVIIMIMNLASYAKVNYDFDNLEQIEEFVSFYGCL